MLRRQSSYKAKANWPVIWLMTDERFGEELLPAIRRLPSRSGVIFRHYSLKASERRRLFGLVRSLCRRRGHILILAGPERQAIQWNADGFHQRSGASTSGILRSAPVHSRNELREALRNRVDLIFLSPLFDTSSHPDSRPLGRPAFNALARQRGSALVIALGGMSKKRARTLNGALVHGWAAIDSFRKKLA